MNILKVRADTNISLKNINVAFTNNKLYYHFMYMYNYKSNKLFYKKRKAAAFLLIMYIYFIRLAPGSVSRYYAPREIPAVQAPVHSDASPVPAHDHS
ncbi:hypothetical protein GCM10007190_02940 [Macrococcus hajekii]|nr:hypothetical protein GCM10007190_02940 [Macrococcus hajekii]